MTSAHHAPSFAVGSLCPGLYEVARPRGGPADTRICVLDLAQAVQWRDQALALLAQDERARNARFLRQADADRHALTRAALRCMLGAWLGLAPGDVALRLGAQGKPALADGSGPHFNVSHAGGLSLIGLSASHAIGIDIEVIDPLRPVAELAGMLLSAQERACYGMPCSSEVFHRIWTAREALFKAWGCGLRDDLDAWSMLPIEGSAELKLMGPGTWPGPTRLWQLPTPAGHAATLALQTLPD